MSTKQYYKKPEYDGFETDYRILDALEEITGTDITDDESAAYKWWANGGNEDQIVEYINIHYPDWKESAPLYWGAGGVNADGTTY